MQYFDDLYLHCDLVMAINAFIAERKCKRDTEYINNLLKFCMVLISSSFYIQSAHIVPECTPPPAMQSFYSSPI